MDRRNGQHDVPEVVREYPYVVGANAGIPPRHFGPHVVVSIKHKLVCGCEIYAHLMEKARCVNRDKEEVSMLRLQGSVRAVNTHRDGIRTGVVMCMCHCAQRGKTCSNLVRK